MNDELILALQDAANAMKNAAILMLDHTKPEQQEHAAELYGASEIIEQWIQKMEAGE